MSIFHFGLIVIPIVSPFLGLSCSSNIYLTTHHGSQIILSSCVFGSLVPRPPLFFFCSSVCVQYNTQKRRRSITDQGFCDARCDHAHLVLEDCLGYIVMWLRCQEYSYPIHLLKEGSARLNLRSSSLKFLFAKTFLDFG